MAIEKMELVNIAGLIKDLDAVLLKCCQSKCFHMELATHSSENTIGLTTLNEDNPYTLSLKKATSLATNLSVKLGYTDYAKLDIFSIEEYNKFIEETQLAYNDYNAKLQGSLQSISEIEQALLLIEHLTGLTANFEQLFACKHVKVRVGKLPVDSYSKLAYYDDKDFFFVPFESNESYYWGIYFSPLLAAPIVDDIFKSLYFERVRVPDFVKGTPEKAKQELISDIETQKAIAKELTKKIKDLSEKNAAKLKMIYSKLKLLNDTYEMRRLVANVNGKFYMVGFVPTNQTKKFEKLFDDISSVAVFFKPPDADEQIPPPTRLKNGFFSRPFTAFVEMYGLPSYKAINPTVYMALTYTLLFGIMFGDMGQGFVIFLIGLFMSKVKKMSAGGILSRIGLSSMVFGFMYGSLFGFETALDPLYTLIGLEGKPIRVFEQANFLLICSVILGASLICISIILNIILGFRQKNYEKALFGPNGLVGLIFYLALAGGAGLTIGMGINVFTVPYIIFLVIIPILIMFFRVPLSNYLRYRKLHADDEEVEGIGIFITENFFEVFEFMLSYVTNTMSFLRVGGFILSHAGMMLVVMTLAEGVSAGVSPIIIIIGNIFVMGMEGLIVGIQSLRLEFYEIFSRFYESEGKPFVPVGVCYETDTE